MPTHDTTHIPEGWKGTIAEEYCFKVADGTHDSPKQSEEGKYLVTSKNLKDGRLDLRSSYKISLMDFELVNKRSKVDKGDILVGMIGTVGEVCLIKNEPDFAIKNVGLFKCGDYERSVFLYYFLKSNRGQGYISSRLSGTTQKYITLGDLRKFPIIHPIDPAEQRAIADILSSLDAKIELLREQNETLEKTAQTIFQEWFGRYSVESPEELPEGWRVGKLGEEFDITIGRTPPRAESEWFSDIPAGMKWISIKDIGNSGTFIFDTSEYLTGEAISKFNVPIIPKNTTILSFKMTVGKLTITTEDMISNEAIAHMKIKENSYLTSEYIYLWLHSLDFNSLGSTSSIVTAINSTMIKNIDFIIPSEEILRKFMEHILPVFHKIHNNSIQIQSLSKTRDELLPRLMSGDVRVV